MVLPNNLEVPKENIAEQNMLIDQNVNTIKDVIESISNLESLIESNKDQDDDGFDLDKEISKHSTSE